MSEEQFQTFDRDGTPEALVPRSQVHRQGLWHRAVHVFVFRPGGTLLLQRRQLDKDVWPGAWDLSAAEHLKPGENFEAGAIRGLEEELGIVCDVVIPLGDVKSFCLDIPEQDIKDHEFQQSFGTLFDGPISVDHTEVWETRWIDRDGLAGELESEAALFTPWFRAEMEDLNILGRWQALVDSLPHAS